MIVGNKTDLHRERVVSTEEGKRLADTWKASFYEVSARSHEVQVREEYFPYTLKSLKIFFFVLNSSPFVRFSTDSLRKWKRRTAVATIRAIVAYRECWY